MGLVADLDTDSLSCCSHLPSESPFPQVSATCTEAWHPCTFSCSTEDSYVASPRGQQRAVREGCCPAGHWLAEKKGTWVNATEMDSGDKNLSGCAPFKIGMCPRAHKKVCDPIRKRVLCQARGLPGCLLPGVAKAAPGPLPSSTGHSLSAGKCVAQGPGT